MEPLISVGTEPHPAWKASSSPTVWSGLAVYAPAGIRASLPPVSLKVRETSRATRLSKSQAT